MATKLSTILNTFANKPKTQLNNYGFSENVKKRSIHKIINNHFSNFKINNTLYLLWNNKTVPNETKKSLGKTYEKSYEKPRKKVENSLIIDDPFKSNYLAIPYKQKQVETKERQIEIPKEKTYKSIQECLISTLFTEYEISLNREGFIKEFRNFLALKGNDIFPDYKFISKIIKKLEFGEELMQSKTIFKTEWFSVISLIFYINIIYFKGYQNYSNFTTYLPIDKNKRTLIINENETTIGKNLKGEIKENINDILEKINPNYNKSEVEKMKLDEIQKYSKYLGISIYKEGKVGYVHKTKEELTNEIFPNKNDEKEIINEI